MPCNKHIAYKRKDETTRYRVRSAKLDGTRTYERSFKTKDLAKRRLPEQTLGGTPASTRNHYTLTSPRSSHT